MITRLNRGGPLRQLEAIVPGLARAGFDETVLVGRVGEGEDDGTADLERVGAHVVAVPGLARGVDATADARALRWLTGYLRRTRPDVVHTHTAKAGALGRVAARLAGVPACVHTFHGHHLDADGAVGFAARGLERSLARLTTRLVCLSPRQRDDVVVRHRIAPARQVVVIPPVIDVASLRACATAAAVADVRARLARDGDVVLLWIGRHVAVKDPLALVEAFARAHARRPQLRLWLVGEGPLRASVLARSAALGIAERVADVGPVARSAPYVAAADAVVLSSRSEGTPIAILEAQALGTFVVATAVGGVPDLVPSGGPGVLVPPHDVDALSAAMARVESRTGPASARTPTPTSSDAIERLAALYRAPHGG